MRTEVCAECARSVRGVCAVCAAATAGTTGIGAASPELVLRARTAAHTVCGCARALSVCCV